MNTEQIAEARRLRSQGMSCGEIAEVLNRSRSTIQKWIRDIELSSEQKQVLQKRRNDTASSATRKTAAREEARRLRLEGLSLKEIEERLEVSQASISVWVRDIPLTAEQKKALLQRRPMYYGHTKGSHSNHFKYKAIRQQYQQEGRNKAREANSLHIAGCMLYWAEGTKSRNRVIFVNSDPDMIVFFRKFLCECLDVSIESINVRINCYTSNDISQKDIENFWLDKLYLPVSNLRKTTINLKPKSSQQRGRILTYGVCTLYVSRSTPILQHIYGALQEYIGIDKPDWV